ncbi:S-layer homology domain-containing protein [Cyanobacterium aponinum FACHB-4101]|uniref:S-layer homology domain-containing protein n=1 Tax=Cyanobacterium aponinum TaxID=379064 RepID=UPI00167FE6B8|nr:S-layer homology domain-containing protein [Cyanobacterium aponinum]MBD2393402.1 S-layer homology domain-containing protein [Cyanobacterium aponinum FACHB-4101]
MARILYFLPLLIILAGCSGNQALESRFAPDSQLNDNTTNTTDGANNPNQTDNSTLADNPENNSDKINLPSNFPQIIPIYEPSTLINVNQQTIKWRSPDPLNLIVNYYQQELSANNWQITKSQENSIDATHQGDNLTLSLILTAQGSETELSLTYNTSESTNNSSLDTPTENTENTVSEDLTPPLQELARLGIVSNSEVINPYNTISRREYARWLVQTNNLLFQDVNSKLIREANPNSKPIFTDVPVSDPDFAVIQGLAEAGLIPSPLLKQGEFTSFNPDKPLTRENLITWKVPLDFREKLPNVTLDALKETWGFQDLSKIDPGAWSALYLDWQNGESANTRKAFGYIILFQPQKEVTYDEAARVLSSFGTNTDISYLKNVNK